MIKIEKGKPLKGCRWNAKAVDGTFQILFPDNFYPLWITTLKIKKK